MKLLGGHKLNISVLTEISKYCLDKSGITISLWRAAINLGNGLKYLGVSMGPLWPLTQFENAHPAIPIFLMYSCLLKVNIKISWNIVLWGLEA